jgi:hypothetical protein
MTPSQKTRLHLALTGVNVEPLRLLLQDVLGDSGVPHEFTANARACDVVIVMVTWGEELAAIADARVLAGDVPVLAILPFGDDDLARRVLAAGAQSCFALGTPLALLRASLVKLADLAA